MEEPYLVVVQDVHVKSTLPSVSRLCSCYVLIMKYVVLQKEGTNTSLGALQS